MAGAEAVAVGVDEQFAQIMMANFDTQPRETHAAPGAESPLTLPYGAFTEGQVAVDGGKRAAMASSTGYTGNNTEESW
jgi:hypothetical protein